MSIKLNRVKVRLRLKKKIQLSAGFLFYGNIGLNGLNELLYPYGDIPNIGPFE